MTKGEYTAIRQRSDMEYKLNQYDKSEVIAYIKRHLTYAGREHEMFSDEEN